MTHNKDIPTVSSTADRLNAYISRLGKSKISRIIPLAGDASDRNYFRLILENGQSKILVIHKEPFNYKKLPFVNVTELLHHLSIPSPAILGHADDLGILILEDLGDLTLQSHLKKISSAEKTKEYRKAIDIIVTLQQQKNEQTKADYIPYQLAFDTKKLASELNFFITYFIETHRGVSISKHTRSALQKEFNTMATTIAMEPRLLCHRDFHSRNMMVREEHIYLIDFQDARMGPEAYDLASLLRDSYIDLSDKLFCDSIDYFLSRKGGRHDPKKFREHFDLVAMQRNLKALGTFGYQVSERQNAIYLQYIPRTLRYVRQTLSGDHRFNTLRPILGELVHELREVNC